MNRASVSGNARGGTRAGRRRKEERAGRRSPKPAQRAAPPRTALPARASIARASTRHPAARSAGVALSASLWLTPPAQGTDHRRRRDAGSRSRRAAPLTIWYGALGARTAHRRHAVRIEGRGRLIGTSCSVASGCRARRGDRLAPPRPSRARHRRDGESRCSSTRPGITLRLRRHRQVPHGHAAGRKSGADPVHRLDHARHPAARRAAGPSAAAGVPAWRG